MTSIKTHEINCRDAVRVLPALAMEPRTDEGALFYNHVCVWEGVQARSAGFFHPMWPQSSSDDATLG